MAGLTLNFEVYSSNTSNTQFPSSNQDPKICPLLFTSLNLNQKATSVYNYHGKEECMQLKPYVETHGHSNCIATGVRQEKIKVASQRVNGHWAPSLGQLHNSRMFTCSQYAGKMKRNLTIFSTQLLSCSWNMYRNVKKYQPRTRLLAIVIYNSGRD